MSVASKLSEFWFRPIDGRVYVLMRMAFAFAATVNILLWWPSALDLLSDQGLHATDPTTGFSVFHIFNSPIAVALMMMIAVLVHVLLFIGVKPRVCLVLSFIWHLSYFNYSQTGCGGMDFILGNFCFILLLSPLGSILNKSSLKMASSAPAYGAYLLRIQVFVVYWSTLLKRIHDPYWKNGDFFGYFMLSEFSTNPGEWVLDALPFLRYLTWAAILVELAIPLLLTFRKTWKIGLVIGIAFHLSIALIAPVIWEFTVVCIATFAAFFRFRDRAL